MLTLVESKWNNPPGFRANLSNPTRIYRLKSLSRLYNRRLSCMIASDFPDFRFSPTLVNHELPANDLLGYFIFKPCAGRGTQAEIEHSSMLSSLTVAFNSGHSAQNLRIVRHRAHRTGLSPAAPIADKTTLRFAGPKHRNSERPIRLQPNRTNQSPIG